MSDNCDMLNALKDNKKILDNIDIWKKVRPAAAVLPVTYLALTVGINAIIPSILWLGTLGITELYVLYKGKKAKKNIKAIESIINNIEINREYSNTDNIDKEVKNNLNNYDSYVTHTYDKPKTKVRKKVKNI